MRALLTSYADTMSLPERVEHMASVDLNTVKTENPISK